MGRMLYLAGVTTLALDQERCLGCGRCLEVCPQGVLALVAGKARIMVRDACMECGACRTNCPAEAIRVRSGVGCAQALLSGKGGGGCC